MNVILLTSIIFTLALVHGANRMNSNSEPDRSEPCQQRNSSLAYKDFKRKHILPLDFDTRSPEAWKRWQNLLRNRTLCNRRGTQSFIPYSSTAAVEGICSSAGRRLEINSPEKGNLCISSSRMTVYDVTVKPDCDRIRYNKRKHYVIVACNLIGNGNMCRPVHYEKYNNQSPGNIPCNETSYQALLNE